MHRIVLFCICTAPLRSEPITGAPTYYDTNNIYLLTVLSTECGPNTLSCRPHSLLKRLATFQLMGQNSLAPTEWPPQCISSRGGFSCTCNGARHLGAASTLPAPSRHRCSTGADSIWEGGRAAPEPKSCKLCSTAAPFFLPAPFSQLQCQCPTS